MDELEKALYLKEVMDEPIDRPMFSKEDRVKMGLAEEPLYIEQQARIHALENNPIPIEYEGGDDFDFRDYMERELNRINSGR